MKKEVSDDALNYIFNMLQNIYPYAKGDTKGHLKRLIRKLNPPRTHIKLTYNQKEVLLTILFQASTMLESKTDEHSERVKTVINYMRGIFNEAS